MTFSKGSPTIAGGAIRPGQMVGVDSFGRVGGMLDGDGYPLYDLPRSLIRDEAGHDINRAIREGVCERAYADVMADMRRSKTRRLDRDRSDRIAYWATGLAVACMVAVSLAVAAGVIGCL